MTSTGRRRLRGAGTRREVPFAGWRIAALSAVVLAMTGPGQTNGVSVFVDPMMAELSLSRSQVSGAYLVGTLLGAVAMPAVGRLFDRRGARTAMTLVGGAFGFALTAMAGVVGLVSLVIGFVGIRALGQGGLSLVATTAPAPWFRRRRGTAIGVVAAVGGAGISLIPLVGERLVAALGWRWAWVALAVLVWIVVLPIARRGIIDRPADVGQQVDGGTAEQADESAADEVAFTRPQAVRTAMFWAVAGAVAATGMIGTGLAFHQIDLLGARGLTPVEAAANFLPQSIAATVATLAVGSLVDRVRARWLLVTSMVLLATAMLAVPLVRPGVVAVAYGLVLGSAGAAARALEAASFPRLFGIAHLGSIRGVVVAVSVASTAFGPLALSLGQDLTGSYVQVLRWLLVIPAVVAVLGLVAPTPTPPTGIRD